MPPQGSRRDYNDYNQGEGMHKSLVLAAVATMALAAGSSTGPAGAQSGAGLCSQPNHHCIMVTIDKDPTGAYGINVDVRELTVRGSNHVIFWRINNVGAQKYRFPANGIEFKTAAGKREFGCAPQGSGGIVIRCTDPNQAKGRFEYAVRVSGVPAVPVLDPWVINE